MLIHCWWFHDFLVDDAAISFSYARNLAEGHGLVLVANFERVEGYSNFLWVVMLAAGARLGFDLALWAHLLGALSALATVAGVAALAASLRGRASAWDAVPTLFVAILVPVPYWAMSGLEGGLYTALVVWCGVALAREGADLRRAWPPVSAALAAAIALTRPDGLAVLVGAGLVFWWQPHGWRSRVRWLFVALTPVLAHLLWRRSYYAFWLPNTFYAKAQSHFRLGQLIDWNAPGWRYVLNLTARYRLVALAVPALIAAVAPGPASTVRRGVALLAVCLVAFPVYAGGDWMSEGRFLVAALPLLCVLALAGIERAAKGRRLKTLLIVACVVSAAGLVVPEAIRHSMTRRHDYPVPVESVAARAHLYRAMATKYEVERPSALDGDLGGTSFYARMPIVDMGMLGDITFARAKGNRELLREYVYYERQPTFMMQVGFWKSLGLRDAPEFSERYVPLPGATGLFVDRRIFLQSVMDTRTPLATFPDAGVDLLAAEIKGEIALWLLVRETPAVSLRLKSATGVDSQVVHPVLSIKDWRAGDIVKVAVPRPAGLGLRLCSERNCISLENGFVGRTVFNVVPSRAALARAVARKDWEVALRIATARKDSTASIAQELFHRAENGRRAGDTHRAFRDYALALSGNPALAMARRRLEELRQAPRAHPSALLGAKYELAKRRFLLAPTPENMSAVAALGHGAGQSEAARLHLATGVRPADDDAALDLAELLAESGWTDEAVKLLPFTTKPGTPGAARAAALSARSGISDRASASTVGDASNQREIAAGLFLVGAWAKVDANAPKQVVLALRRTTYDKETLYAGERQSLFDRPPVSWSANEVYLHTLYDVDVSSGQTTQLATARGHISLSSDH